ncbi:branched-chain amino acid ABC transporter permease [Micromonospora rubida]|uniref:Branched-chain amino acid ABC transporter permease n=1 Tax=Micromonospora rubida TaxID=2697657 RepID=A0ABW7SPE7_9ACTN
MIPLQVIVSIIETGCFFGLLAAAMFVVRESSGFFNFAIGGYAVFAGLASAYFTSVRGLPAAAGIVIGVIGAVALALLTEVLVVRPMWKPGANEELPMVIALVATLFALEQISGVLFGRAALPGPQLVGDGAVRLGSATVTAQAALEIGLTALAFGLLLLFIYRTRMGRGLRAIGENTPAAIVLGLPVRAVRIASFTLAGVLAGLAGSVFAARSGIIFESAMDYTLFAFLALVIGGTASVWGPLAGGLILATIQSAAIFYFGAAALHYATLAAAVLFFAFRPQGIFMKRVRV